jgi:hypothetical protein
MTSAWATDATPFTTDPIGDARVIIAYLIADIEATS